MKKLLQHDVLAGRIIGDFSLSESILRPPPCHNSDVYTCKEAEKKTKRLSSYIIKKLHANCVKTSFPFPFFSFKLVMQIA